MKIAKKILKSVKEEMDEEDFADKLMELDLLDYDSIVKFKVKGKELVYEIKPLKLKVKKASKHFDKNILSSKTINWSSEQAPEEQADDAGIDVSKVSDFPDDFIDWEAKLKYDEKKDELSIQIKGEEG